jgi:hypothetical protein
MRSLELFRGPELVQFALERDHLYDLVDLDTGAQGAFRIQAGTITVQWFEQISGGVAVLNNEQICTRTENGTKRCYALFDPGPKFSAVGCVYLLQSVYEKRNACLRLPPGF